MRRRIPEIFMYTVVTLVGSLSPLILIALHNRFDKNIGQFPNLTEIAGRGEIDIICIPLGISIIYSLYSTKVKLSFLRWSDFIFWVTLVFSILGIYLYGIVLQPNNTPNVELLHFSCYFLVWCLIALISSKSIEINRSGSVSEARNATQNGLERRVESKL